MVRKNHARPGFPGVHGFLIAAQLVFATLIVGFFAIFHGHAHGTKLPAGQSGLLYSTGFVLVTLSRALVVSLTSMWARIVARVMGSWIAASGMLMVGWYLKGAG